MIEIDHRLDSETLALMSEMRAEISHTVSMMARLKLRPLIKAGLGVGKTYRIQRSYGNWLMLTVLELTSKGDQPRVYGQALNRKKEREGEPLGAPRNFDPVKWRAIEEVQIGN